MQTSVPISRSLGREPNLSQSAVFQKNKHSRVYESFHLQNLSQGRIYDSTYAHGYPKLYSYDLTGPQRVADDKSKYSFKNSRVVDENDDLRRENQFLRSEVSRLTHLLETERRTAISRTEIDRLNSIITTKTVQTTRLEQRIAMLEKQTTQASQTNWEARYNESLQKIAYLQRQLNQPNQWELKYNQSQNIINQLNIQIQNISSQSNHFQSQINQYVTRISQLEQQLANASSQVQQNISSQSNHFQSQINQYVTRISQLEQQLGNASSQVQIKDDPQVGILRQKIDRLTQEICELKSTISQYQYQINTLKQKAQSYSPPPAQVDNTYELNELKRTISQYEKQISTLQTSNWRLEEKITTFENQAVNSRPAQSLQNNEEWIVREGALNLRIIILLEQINRLNQREVQLRQKSEELHAYLLKAQNYIEEVQGELERNNLKENIPVHMVEKMTRLEEQNTRYAHMIQQLEIRLTQTTTNSYSQGASRVNQQQLIGKLGERDLRIIILLEQINRLNQKTTQIRDYLARAEDYIDQLQRSIQDQATVIPPEVENQINILNQENSRLNVLIQNYITEINSLKVTIHNWETRVNVNSSEARVQYRISPQIQAKIAFLAQENERLRLQLSKSTQISVQSNNNPDISQETAKLYLKSIFLLEQINRLNQVVSETRGFLVRAEDYIEQCQLKISEISRSTKTTEVVRQVFRTPPEVESKLSILTQQNQKLTRSITELSNRPSRVETKVEHKVEFRIPPEIQAKISFLAQENERLRLQISQTTISSSSQHNDYAIKYGELQLKSIILLEEINRLNVLTSDLRGHLIQAQDYIYEIQNRTQQTSELSPEVQSRIALLSEENSRLTIQINTLTLNYQQQINHYKTEINNYITQINQYKTEITLYTTQINNYKTQIYNYSVQINELQSKSLQTGDISAQIKARIALLTSENERLLKIVHIKTNADEVITKAGLDWGREHLKTIILLEEINRLNFKLSQGQNLGSSQNEVIELREHKQRIQGELQEVLEHLRRAEDYIQQVNANKEELEEERNFLANELNRIQGGH